MRAHLKQTTPRSQSSSAGEYKSLPGVEDILRAELPNGIVVLARENFNSPSVAISGYLTVGSLADPDDRLGLADYTAATLMRGTQLRSFNEIYELLESAGASLGFDSGTHSTGFSGKALSEDLDMLLDLLAEAVCRPVFPIEHVERLRAQLLTGLAIRSQDTADMAAMTFDKIVYNGHPYSRPEDGYPETIQAISQQDLVDFHRRYYGPRGVVIAIAGSVKPEQALASVHKYLGDWRSPEQAVEIDLPEHTALTSTIRSSVTIPGKFQSDIVMGAAGPPRKSPDYMAALLGNNILGQFGMMGRIGDVVREKAGLAYYASSSLGGGSGPGPWRVSAGVAPANVDQAVVLISDEISKFYTEPVLPEELADSQANFIGRLPLSLESNGGVAGAMINLERYQLGLDYYYRYAEIVHAVKLDDVLQAAQRYLDPGRLGIAVAGPV